jgi:hypothetical protein
VLELSGQVFIRDDGLAVNLASENPQDWPLGKFALEFDLPSAGSDDFRYLIFEPTP